MDGRIFRWINDGPEWLSPGMRFFSVGFDGTPIKLLLVAILIGMLAAGKTTRRAAILALIAFPIADGLTNLIKHAWPMVRPCNDPNTVAFLRIGATTSAGTASAHSANMAAVATVFLGCLRGFGVPWTILAFLVGYSRVYNGVHYPYQVALGWLVGISVGLAVFFLARRIEWTLSARREKRSATRVETEGPA